MKKGEWKQKDGSVIKIKDMTDSHLLNTIALLERYAHRQYIHLISSFPSFQGEMAQFIAEGQWEQMVEDGPEGCLPDKYDELEEEVDRRNLCRRAKEEEK